MPHSSGRWASFNAGVDAWVTWALFLVKTTLSHWEFVPDIWNLIELQPAQPSHTALNYFFLFPVEGSRSCSWAVEDWDLPLKQGPAVTTSWCPVLVSRGWFLHTTSEGLKVLSSKKYLLKCHFSSIKIILWHLATAFDTKPKDRWILSANRSDRSFY